jgi:hypothetical protein
LNVVTPVIDVGYERLALAVVRTLGRRGGAIDVLKVGDAVARVIAGRFDLFTSPALVWPPSVANFKFHSNAAAAGNFWGYSDRRVDEALDVGDWESALKALAENPPLVFICLPERLIAIDSRIKHPRLGPLVPLEFVPDWEVRE